VRWFCFRFYPNETRSCKDEWELCPLLSQKWCDLFRSTTERICALSCAGCELPVTVCNCSTGSLDCLINYKSFSVYLHTLVCLHESMFIRMLSLCLSFRYSFICQGTTTRKQRSKLFGLRVKLPPVTTSLTTQR